MVLANNFSQLNVVMIVFMLVIATITPVYWFKVKFEEALPELKKGLITSISGLF